MKKVIRLTENQLKEIIVKVINEGQTQNINVNLSNRNLNDIPKEVLNNTNIRVLNLTDNNLTELPDSIGDLTNLRALGLNGNNLTELPDSFSKLINLGELFITNNNFSEIPQVIGSLPKLIRLYLGGNNGIRNLPQQISRFPNLKNLLILSLGSLNISKEELNQIQQLLPNTRISKVG